MTTADRTAAAIDARRTATNGMVERVRTVIAQMSREHAKVTFAGVARRADVSRTFLYEHPEARKLVDEAVNASTSQRMNDRAKESADVEANWRERALNAEDGLSETYREIAQQRTTIGELLGRIRDLEGDLPEDSIQRLITENTDLKKRLIELTQANRGLTDRLRGSRDNNRFLDKRIADLEATLLDLQPTTGPGSPRQN
ncbi:DUF6262 family protein [Nocardia sp. NPDC101769]|uniref:DUF6262 family protein n=1 Tax=Nocardia sp. NPDC101769 TaxID=3364333 RepID=UPI00381282DF